MVVRGGEASMARTKVAAARRAAMRRWEGEGVVVVGPVKGMVVRYCEGGKGSRGEKGDFV